MNKMRMVMLFFYLILALLGITFAALNAVSVKINFYFTTIRLPVCVLIIIVLGIGFLLGYLMMLVRHVRLQAESRRLKHQLKLTEQEIKNLRTIPVTDDYAGFGER